MYKNNKLIPKQNGSGRISSFTLTVSLSEAKQLGITPSLFDDKIIKKEIINGQLIISRAFPQDSDDMKKILEEFGIVGKRLSKKMLLELLYFIEGDSLSYQNQKNKIYASIRYLGRNWIGYKGQYAFFNFKIKMNKNRIIESFSATAPTSLPDFE